MQPASATLSVRSAASATCRRSHDRPSARLLRCHRLDNLALLKRHGRLRDDRLVAVQPGLNINRVAEVTPQLDLLKTDGVPLSNGCHPSALRIEDDRRRG